MCEYLKTKCKTCGYYGGAHAEQCSESTRTVGCRYNLPDQIFDGYAVYRELDDRAKMRTSPENVSDVIDALARLIKKD